MNQTNPFEDKRTAFGMLLILVFIMLYSEFFITPVMRPKQQPVQAPQTGSAQSPQISAQRSAHDAPAASVADQQRPTLRAVLDSPTTLVHSRKFTARINHLGARLTSFRLSEHREHLDSADTLEMIPLAEGAIPPLGVYAGTLRDESVAYTLADVQGGRQVGASGFEVGHENLVLTFRGTLAEPGGAAEPLIIEKKITFLPETFLFSVDVKLSRPIADALWIEWTKWLNDATAVHRLDPWKITMLTVEDRITHRAIDSNLLHYPPRQAFPAKWLSLDDKYFTVTAAGTGSGASAWLTVFDEMGRPPPLLVNGASPPPDLTPPELKFRSYALRMAGSGSEASVRLFVGPKDYSVLKAADLQLERVIDLGFFSFLAHPLLDALRLFNRLLGNWGLSIVALTLALKFLFFPLQRAALKSMQAQQELQPEIQALRARIKDPNQLNQEIFALFKRRGINPVGGCLPILLQIPVFFGLNSALMSALELRHAPFAVWIKDLSTPEHLPALWGINVPVMTLLMMAIMLYQQFKVPMEGIDPQQRKIMLIMFAIFPVMFLIYPFPSGLAIYVFVNTLITFVQQSYMKRDKKANPFPATALAGVGVFFVAYVLTLL